MASGKDGSSITADQAPDLPSTSPGRGPDTSPNFDLVDARIAKALDARGIGDQGGGTHNGGMTDDSRLAKLENEVHAIKGAVDWAKVAFAILATVTLGGMGILISLNLSLSSKVGGVSDRVIEEFRAQRLEQAAQISAISNAITASKQQAPAPQVIFVPPTPTAPRPPKGHPQ